MKRDYSERDAEVAVLLRAAIRGDKDALGELLMSFQGLIRSVVQKHLDKWKRLDEVEDLVQDVYLDAIKSFPTHDPSRGAFGAWVLTICQGACYNWTERNLVLLHSDPIPDNNDAEDDEYVSDPLERATFLAWESEFAAEPARPISMSNRHLIRRQGRTVTLAREKKKKEALAAAPKIRKKRDGRKLTKGQVIRVKKSRQAFAQATPELPATEERELVGV